MSVGDRLGQVPAHRPWQPLQLGVAEPTGLGRLQQPVLQLQHRRRGHGRSPPHRPAGAPGHRQGAQDGRVRDRPAPPRYSAAPPSPVSRRLSVVPARWASPCRARNTASSRVHSHAGAPARDRGARTVVTMSFSLCSRRPSRPQRRPQCPAGRLGGLGPCDPARVGHRHQHESRTGREATAQPSAWRHSHHASLPPDARSRGHRPGPAHRSPPAADRLLGWAGPRHLLGERRRTPMRLVIGGPLALLASASGVEPGDWMARRPAGCAQRR